MRTSAMLPVAVLALSVLAGCGAAEEGFRAGSGQAAAPAPAPAPQTAPASPAPPPVVPVTLPDGEGRNGAIVLDELRRLGLTNVQPASRDEQDRVVVNPANWTVTKIEPEPGTEVPSDSTVVVTMTKE